MASSHTSGDKDETFWDKKAYKQCLWGYYLEHKLPTLDQEHMDIVWQVFQQIEEDAEMRFEPKIATGYDKWKAFKTSPTSQVVQGFEMHPDGAVTNELPTIQIEDEVAVEGIPF